MKTCEMHPDPPDFREAAVGPAGEAPPSKVFSLHRVQLLHFAFKLTRWMQDI